MVARLAVRFERAGLFFRLEIEQSIGDSLGNRETFLRRMGGFLIADLGLRCRLFEFI